MDAIAATRPASSGNLAAIARAAQSTGERFDFLLAKAQLESGLNPAARARTSSATGLFQFIERTWLATVKRHGARHGLGWAAEAIERVGDQFSVASAGLRAVILKLREDPDIAAAMAAEHAADNRAHLEARLDRPVTDTELYLAHFLGAGGALRALGALATQPDRPAASLLPRAARANRAIFYQRDGQPRTLAQLLDHLGTRLARAAARALPGSAPAPAPPSAALAAASAGAGTAAGTAAGAAAIAAADAVTPPSAAAAATTAILLALRSARAGPSPSPAAPGAAATAAGTAAGTAAAGGIDPARAAQAAWLLLARLA